MSRVLILGAKGRMGAAMARRWADRHVVTALARPEVDIANLSSLEALLKSSSYDVLVNGTGLTNVDRCETDREEAETVNAKAPGLMAAISREKGARFIHISTDYVFDGVKTSPYTEDDAALPLSHYGQTKLDGENATLAGGAEHLVFRVSWVFGPDKPSFVDAIIDRARTNDHVEAIADKTSCPTSAEDAADWLEAFLSGAYPGGLYHACNSGPCTWQAYGQHALDSAAAAGVELEARTVAPIPLSGLKAFVAPRPPHTAMNTDKLSSVLGHAPRPWQEALTDYITKKFQ